MKASGKPGAFFCTGDWAQERWLIGQMMARTEPGYR